MFPFLFQALGLEPGWWNPAIFMLDRRAEGVFARELEVGQGKPAREGGRITVEFVASTLAGHEVANTEKRGLPFVFAYPHQPDIWSRMVAEMNVGGSRLILLSPENAYGPKGVPGIVPPGEPLLIWVKVTSAVPAASPVVEDPEDPG